MEYLGFDEDEEVNIEKLPFVNKLKFWVKKENKNYGTMRGNHH